MQIQYVLCVEWLQMGRELYVMKYYRRFQLNKQALPQM